MDLTLDHNPRCKARVLSTPSLQTVTNWLRAGVADFRANLRVSLLYGFGLAGLGWATILGLIATGLGWMILPALAGAMLVGPVATVGLYQISRRAGGMDKPVAAPGQVFLVGVVMMILVLLWIRSATLLFAVFYGLRPFAGPVESALTVFSSGHGLALFASGLCVGGLFAAFGFAISVFSFPMLVHREVDGFSAMGLSFNATTQNFSLLLLWGVCITGLVSLGVLTGLILMIPLFPILGYATWHAYADLFES
ncbi:putative integral membrane protein [Ruegeria sp. THAF57]|uniref:DUF2189 domain-containing protein n=1 Tax=Ruegeria sp. THAF57 TaxID=2744555 RepID=UPI0015DEB5F3|nr:DUF2189 domain-containing protein [Ruegeria sp. THAF57]CAD0187001.1 putative integral membrane protein [Ruegeria sp. THAF57]